MSVPNFVPIHQADVKIFHRVMENSDLMMALDDRHGWHGFTQAMEIHRLVALRIALQICMAIQPNTWVWTRLVEWLTISQHLCIIVIPPTGICIFCNSNDHATAHQYSILLWIQQQQLLTDCPPSPTHVSSASQCQWSRWRHCSVYSVLRTNVFRVHYYRNAWLTFRGVGGDIFPLEPLKLYKLVAQNAHSYCQLYCRKCLGSSVLRPFFIETNLETHVMTPFRSLKGAPCRCGEDILLRRERSPLTDFYVITN